VPQKDRADIPSERSNRKATSATPGPPGATHSLTEGDLIIGKNNGSAIGTLVERSTRYVMLVHLPDGYKAEQARDGLIATIKTLPQHLRRSLT